MKVSGFSFIRNGEKYDYPFIEAIESILPVCDEFVVAVGNSDDTTLERVRQIHLDKIKIIETVWDDSLREGGRVLAVETDKAFQAISADTDWCFYIQGDEVIHEKYLPEIQQAMQKWLNHPEVEGLLFNYRHFYGSYDYVGSSFKWYPKEIRIVRNNTSIYSYRDAQGFRIGENQKLRVKQIDAFVHHYGWVKDPRAMQLKQESFNKLWHSDEWVNENVLAAEKFDYSGIDALERYTDTHPKVMQSRIENKNWTFDRDLSLNKLSMKDRFKKFMLRRAGIFIGYKNYKLI